MTTSMFSSPLRLFRPSTLLLPARVYALQSAPKTLQCLRQFHASPAPSVTYNQVRRGCRKPKKARKSVSPALVNRPEMKAVCMNVTVVKPKKPNSAQRKVAKIRLSNGSTVTAYIPGEGELTVHSFDILPDNALKDVLADE